jgi:hypothetical protein
MGEWTKVITHPLGLAGFALFAFLIFFTRRQASTQPIWVRASFIGMAFIALLGGLWLAHLNTTSPPTAEQRSGQQKPLPEPETPTQTSQQKSSSENRVDQKTTGAGSPAVANTGGDVTITVTNP